MYKKIINGREIEYGDELIHTTNSQFGLWDRVKILLGKKVTITSHIYTKEIVNTVASEATTSVCVLFPKKRRSGLQLSGDINACNG